MPDLLKADEDFAEVMRFTREQRGITQQQVADHMRSLGLKWSQSTVWSVERGDRPVRLGEAVEIGQFLGFPLPGQSDDTHLQLELARAKARLKYIQYVVDEATDVAGWEVRDA